MGNPSKLDHEIRFNGRTYKILFNEYFVFEAHWQGFSAEGKTEQEALKNCQELIEDYFTSEDD